MKATIKYFCFILTLLAILTSCGPKPQYKTAVGKKKLKHYNSIQYGQATPKKFKSFKKK
ncbi:hypothetical protein [Fulvivirga ligni]|uniref:hypothetical protein n=1 Tax=Fulvivirga ligni TaxID=2904246 RepID=UPI001F1FF775|nr:hypothetical protein [Fulvivirga ligni]UII23474.1 hypothetical protein LVD16_09565 [Fulvivirga ligni]